MAAALYGGSNSGMITSWVIEFNREWSLLRCTSLHLMWWTAPAPGIDVP